MAFFTIHPAPGLDEFEYQRALSAGPSAVSTRRREIADTLASAGFRHVDAEDRTDQFLEAARAWFRGRREHAEEIGKAMGPIAFRTRQAESLAQIEAVEAGLLRRTLFVTW